jgi:hypothetical protein
MITAEQARYIAALYLTNGSPLEHFVMTGTVSGDYQQEIRTSRLFVYYKRQRQDLDNLLEYLQSKQQVNA